MKKRLGIASPIRLHGVSLWVPSLKEWLLQIAEERVEDLGMVMMVMWGLWKTREGMLGFGMSPFQSTSCCLELVQGVPKEEYYGDIT